MGMLDDDDWWRRQQQQPVFGGENLAPMDSMEPAQGLLSDARAAGAGVLDRAQQIGAGLADKFVPKPDFENFAKGVPIAAQRFMDKVKSGATYAGDVYSGKESAPLPSQTDLSRVDDMLAVVQGGAGAAGLLGYGVPKGAIGTFGGPFAKNAPIKNYQQGAKLERKGATPDDIWQEAGVFRQPGGFWSHEIPNLGHDFTPKAKDAINSGIVITDRLPKLFNAPELTEAYPALANVVTTLKSTGARSEPTGRFGTFSPEGQPRSLQNRPYIEAEGPKNSLRETAIHEINHAADLAEGRFGSTSPDFKGSRDKNIREYIESPEERMARAAANRRDYTPDQLREIHPLKTPEDAFHQSVLDRFAQEDMRRQMVEPKTGLLTRIRSGWM